MHITTTITTTALLLASASAQELAEINASDALERDIFGYSVALADGVLLVSAPRDDDVKKNAGSVYVYGESAGSWIELTELHGSLSSAKDFFGSSLAADGDTFIVGAPAEGNDNGAAYAFVDNGGTWSEEAVLGIGDVGDFLGAAVALSGDTAVVGAPLDDDMGIDSGAVKVFLRTGGVWALQTTLTAGDGAAGDHFGTGVAIDGDTIVVGAPRQDGGADNAGAAYVFVRSANVWSQQDKLVAGDPEHDDAFGDAVAIAADTALVGAFEKDVVGVNSGAAYVFTRSAAIWSEQAKLVPAAAAPFESFGHSVALEPGLAVVGADGASDMGASSGAVYAFAGAGASWEQLARWIPLETDLGDFFGSSVDVAQGLVAIGSGWDDDAGINSGSAHLFSAPLPIGLNYCGPAVPNSSGTAAEIAAYGSAHVDFNVVRVEASQMAPNRFGVFVVSQAQGFTNPPGSQGNLCLSGAIGRYTGDVMNSGGAGAMALQLDLANTPTPGGPVAVLAGETWNWQAWFRDANPASTSNFTDGVSITFN
jgi:FG-GAP repeat